MTRWAEEEERTHVPPATTSLGADLMGVGPASTLGRELLAAVAQIGAVALLCFVVFPDRLSEPARWGLLAAVVVYFVVRFAAGLPKWRRYG